MTKERITQRDHVAITVRFMPGCVLQDVCDALNITSSSAGNMLRALCKHGILNREHNGTQYKYTAAEGADIPDVELPFMREQRKRPNPEKLLRAERMAKTLEEKGFWRRAATVYTSILAIASNASDFNRIARQRDVCLRTARRGW